MLSALAFVSAIVPSLLLAAYFRSRAVFRQPWWSLALAFLLGLAVIPLVWAIARPVGHFIADLGDPYLTSLGQAFFTAAGAEEFGKWLVVAGICSRFRSFATPMDGVVYGATTSLGFATLENVIYVADGNAMTALFRAVSAVPAHAFIGAIMGHYVARWKLDPAHSLKKLAGSLGIAVALHGLYDFPLIALLVLTGRDGLVHATPRTILVLCGVMLSVLLTCWGWAIILVGHYRREQQLDRASMFDGSPYRPRLTPPPTMRALAEARVFPEITDVRRYVTGVFFTAGGSLVASVGGAVMLALVLGRARHATLLGTFDTVVMDLAGGVLPLLAGTWSFAQGLKRLNESS